MQKTEPEATIIEQPAIGRVLVVGAGAMGSGIAQVVAEASIETVLCDSNPANLERGLGAVRSRWTRHRESGKRSEQDVESYNKRLTLGDTQDVANADLVIEAIAENLEAKTRLFAMLKDFAPPATIFASNTSSISITALGHASGRPDRLVGMHFFNPVPVLPLVEIVRGLETSEASVSTCVAFAEEIGKTPVIVNDAPGFIANRILLPMINEAVFALQEGVATEEAIDNVMKLGMSHPMGPLELADLIGLDICLDILETLHRDFGDDKYRPATLLRRMVAAGRLGRKTGRGFYSY